MGMAVLHVDASVACVGMVGVRVARARCNPNETLEKPSIAEMPWKHQLAGNPPYIKAGHGGIGAYNVPGCGAILTNPDGVGGDAASCGA